MPAGGLCGPFADPVRTLCGQHWPGVALHGATAAVALGAAGAGGDHTILLRLTRPLPNHPGTGGASRLRNSVCSRTASCITRNVQPAASNPNRGSSIPRERRKPKLSLQRRLMLSQFKIRGYPLPRRQAIGK